MRPAAYQLQLLQRHRARVRLLLHAEVQLLLRRLLFLRLGVAEVAAAHELLVARELLVREVVGLAACAVFRNELFEIRRLVLFVVRAGALDVFFGADAGAFGPCVGGVDWVFELGVAELLGLRVHDVEGVVDAPRRRMRLVCHFLMIIII